MSLTPDWTFTFQHHLKSLDSIPPPTTIIWKRDKQSWFHPCPYVTYPFCRWLDMWHMSTNTHGELAPLRWPVSCLYKSYITYTNNRYQAVKLKFSILTKSTSHIGLVIQLHTKRRILRIICLYSSSGNFKIHILYFFRTDII